MKLVSIRSRRSCRFSLFCRWLENPVSVYRDKKDFFEFIELQKDPIYGALVEECLTNGLSSAMVESLSNCGIVVAYCFRGDK